MPRILLTLSRPARFRYLDTVHAALVTALRRSGAEEHQVLGLGAAPWTFAAGGRGFPGGMIRMDSITLSTPDPALGLAMLRLNGNDAQIRSSNGDELDLSGAACQPVPIPLHPDQDRLAVSFASPFLVSERGGKKAYARTLAGLDLSSAFSAGLTRRLGREVRLRVEQDRLSAATDGAEPRLVRVRRSGARDLILPALSAVLTLVGRPADLRDAYLAGLGEKTRYGFGCPDALV